MTRSEQFVHTLATNACLRLWTYASPRGKEPGKELCDTLVACPPDVIVISVKEIELQRGVDDVHLAVERWKRRAVDASVKQVYGAVRRLSSISTVTAMDGSTGVELGPPESRQVHRIAVAIGAEDFVPLESRDYGQGFVHVFSAETFELMLSELDTISDLVDYLSARESLLKGGLHGSLIATEHDLLAVFFMNTRTFKPLLEAKSEIIILDNVWDDFLTRPEYAARQEANRISTVWDNLIGILHDDHLNNNMECGDFSSVERVTRVMARESRTERRGLAQGFMEFFESSQVGARMCVGRYATYVFLKSPHGEERSYRRAELSARAWVARDFAHRHGRDGPVVGLATEHYEPGRGFSIDALLFDVPEWNEENAMEANRIRAELGLFAKPVVTHKHADEFPSKVS
jgi:hypothetical protein